jgi:hypothetical protein
MQAQEETQRILSMGVAGLICGEANEMLAYFERQSPCETAARSGKQPGLWPRIRHIMPHGVFAGSFFRA